ncbi:RluA family pseudouridine synthase [Azospirillum thermophilum]|uniref:Pseudouridine synthase n=1 Tax=Azospirillum thermophilum TaxID=2202148 RepID=A0A2S2D031_9PROT|nr:RluA family pseudouridine synthase [Azospirillum thermophilum]AWK90010.1 RluA family pseudouridine synthase [Azospirillum thermophilum]
MSDSPKPVSDKPAVELRTVTADEAEMRLDRWFKRHFPDVNHSYLQKLLRTGQVRVDGKRAETSTRLAAGQAVRIPPLAAWAAPVASPVTAKPKPAISDKEAEELRALVLYKDADVIALNKPAGLAVQGGTGTSRHLDAMLDALRFDSPERPKLVHRLDKDTSGVLLLARNSFAATKLTEQFRGRDVRKIYWAATVGVPKPFQGKVDLPLSKETGGGERVVIDEKEGKKAVTYFSVLENVGKQAAFVAMWPRTGRTHQLRVHMNAIGTPILGDGKYAGQNASVAGAEVPKKLHLHARRLILPHPRGGRTIDVTAPLPDHMQATWKYFGFSPNLRGDPFEGVE